MGDDEILKVCAGLCAAWVGVTLAIVGGVHAPNWLIILAPAQVVIHGIAMTMLGRQNGKNL